MVVFGKYPYGLDRSLYCGAGRDGPETKWNFPIKCSYAPWIISCWTESFPHDVSLPGVVLYTCLDHKNNSFRMCTVANKCTENITKSVHSTGSTSWTSTINIFCKCLQGLFLLQNSFPSDYFVEFYFLAYVFFKSATIKKS